MLSASGGKLLAGDPEGSVSGVCLDSRKVPPGSLFIPLPGDRFDGHDFLDAALRSGAAGALASRTPESLIPGKFYILVPDTRAAMGRLAAWHRSRFDLPVFAVTGSVGKTTTKDMLFSVLSSRFRVHRTEGNFNNDVGVPLTLFGLESFHGAAVVEMGMNHPGEIRALSAMVRPGYAVITNIGDAHIEYLGSRENTLRAKCEVFENIDPRGAAVLNADDPLLRSLRGKLPVPALWCGTAEDADVRMLDISSGADCVRCRVESPWIRGPLEIPAPGRHMIYPAAMAVAAAGLLGLTPLEIRAGIEAFRSGSLRMNLMELSGDRTLLVDCYNANPQSMLAAVEILASAPRGEKIAVLGDMGELGELGPKAHYETGLALGHFGIGRLIAVGPLSRRIRDGADDSGVPRTAWYETKKEALEDLATLPGDSAVLLKASHAMHFEEFADFIVSRFSRTVP
ncbi:UDP-N-acetylmuramoyl-tripeptide--D-alanyl-D-alanine ligase [Papillibacter cinnamivorans]|uniref:UDP-N-acetylmuramoyl-tripeptide--D-alanyl-D- alanine ligase n=1 Tax=Papillibacter cinnamivorans TaxID=100176 RepID=UPI00241D716A|nr:UDP-N-acetylmuramoyl-tripeptide--D-alanyl-D-alanine ligase [Papillibacter cinnamivorans]